MVMNCRIDIPVLALVGPTAIGKTALSLEIAHTLNCEIISVDSMQVYRYMDIGTAKIRPEETEGIPHHLIDIVDPDEEYDAARFVSDATAAIREIAGRGKVPLVTGGTGLYLKALTQGLFADIPEDKGIRAELQRRLEREGTSKLHEELSACDRESAERIHQNDTARILRGLEIYLASGISWSEHLRRQAENNSGGAVREILQVGLTCDRGRLYDRINLRTGMMIDAGLEGEVRGLLAMGYGPELKSMGSIGYRHMLRYLAGEWSQERMIELLARDTRHYAKRQYTWFTRIPAIEWFEVAEPAAVVNRMGEWLAERS